MSSFLPLEELDRPFRSHEEALAEAEAGCARLEAARRDRWYPSVHIASNGGWINDPNGLCFYRGRWHVFYQLHPFGTTWGPMHWGHVSSADMVTWRREPIALAPSINADAGGVFSGSAVTGDDGRLYLYYTGHRFFDPTDHHSGAQEVQCLATSDDGIHFTKRGVVVDNVDQLADFRDPKVWKLDGTWYMIFGQRSADDRGEIVLYRSEDMLDWEFDRVLFRHPDPAVFMLECPDFFAVRDADGAPWWVLGFSAMGSKPSGYLNRNDSNAGYVVGTWRPGQAFEPVTGFHPWDWGQNHYAPQSFAAPDGRQIIYGWMSPKHGLPWPAEDDGWCGQLTLPREISLAEARPASAGHEAAAGACSGTLRLAPAAELAALRTATDARGDIEVGAGTEVELAGDARIAEVELTLDLASSNAARMGVKVHATPDGGFVYVAYDAQTRRVVLDRMAAHQSERGYRSAPVPAGCIETGALALRLYLDRGSIEVYVDGGREVLSAYSFPQEGPCALRLVAEEGSMLVRDVALHQLRQNLL